MLRGDRGSCGSRKSTRLPRPCPPECSSGTAWEGMAEVPPVAGTAPPLGSREARKAAGGGGGAGWGQAFDSASWCWDQPAVGCCWLSLGCSPLSLLGHGMTPPPPGCAALGIPRARVSSRLVRPGVLLRLLLLLLWVVVTTQGHSRSGPRISAVWKGRWRRAACGALEPTPRGAGAAGAAAEGVRAHGSAGPGLSPWGACGCGGV